MTAGSNPGSSTTSIEAYKPSEYAETSWPQIEVAPVESTFRPAQFEVIAQSVFTTDPMFAVFEPEGKVSTQEFTSAREFVSDPSDPASEFAQELQGADQPTEDTAASADEVDQTFVQAVTEELEPSEAPNSGAAAQAAHDDAIAAAREEGYALGVATTRQEVDGVCVEMREQFSGLVEDFKAQSQEMLMEYERKAVELALHVARRMVGTVVETQREYVVSVVREAMQSVGSATIETIRVSPRDFDFLNQGAGEQLKAGSDTQPVFASDETIKSGCVIVTSSGEVDFDLEAAWNRLHSKVVQGPQS